MARVRPERSGLRWALPTPLLERAGPLSSTPYTAAEERLHVLSHGIGLLASLVGLPWLLVTAARHGDGWRLAGGLAFGVTASAMFLASSLYHASTSPRPRAVLRAVDHSAIYLLIAGTYTPFTISVLRGPWGWGLFGTVWAVALAGIVMRTTGVVRLRGLSTVLYLLMGWMCVVGFGPLARSLSGAQLGWLIAGGVLYTLGVPFYVSKKLRYGHAIWHLFVLGGVLCHGVAVASLMRAPSG